MEIQTTILATDYVALKKKQGKSIYYFHYDVEPLKDTNFVICTEQCIVMRNATYEKLVSKCIECKYDISAQLALLYNYEKDPARYKEEMEDYQQWRDYCKNAVKNI